MSNLGFSANLGQANAGIYSLGAMAADGRPGTASVLAAQKASTLSPQAMARIDQTASDFEAVFIGQMLESSFEGVSSNPLSEEGEKGGFADDTYRSMMLQEFGKLMARSGGIGLAQHIKQSMLAMQEVSHAHRQ